MNAQQIAVKSALDAWNNYNERTTKLFDSLTDDQMRNRIAPDRNTGIYLLGHMVAVHDGMLPLFGLDNKKYPELEKVFLREAEDHSTKWESVDELRAAWKEINRLLSEHFAKFSVDDWFKRHESVSEADFEKEPHRNRLNVLLNRTNHLAYHLGQLVFLQG